MRDDVVVIGGGLAGSEAAWQATSNPRRPAARRELTPVGLWPTTPNHNDSGTCSTQTALAIEVGFGAVDQLRPKAGDRGGITS